MLNQTEPDRVRANTSANVNQRIDRQIDENVRRYSLKGNEEISRRVRELAYEWDIERVLETMASSFSLTGIALAATVNKRWLLLPATVLSFLLLHAVQGWCPPVPVFTSAWRSHP